VGQDRNSVSIVAALIIGIAVVVGALLIRCSVERATREIAAVEEALREIELRGIPSVRPPTRAARPDPNRRYSVDTQGSPVMGNPEAKLAIVAFSDFQCPFCSRVTSTLEEIAREYGDDVRIVFKHLPLSMHPKAPAAHAAAEAAHRQGKFWEMHDLIFGDQRGMSPERYLEYAQRIGLDIERFKRDIESDDVKRKIDSDVAEATRLSVTSTPGFFVNGRYLRGAQPFAAFKALIDEEMGRS
jgi:protein-disulfide isomerase